MSRNDERAARAEAILQTYVTEELLEVYEKTSNEIVNLITDLLHLAQRIDQGDDPIESTLELAKRHYLAELADLEQDAEDGA